MLKKPSRVLGGAVAGWMAAFWCLSPVAAYAAAPTQAEIAKDFERSLLAIEDGARDMARDTFDPQYIVDQVGVEPQALYEWVKQNVFWVPYMGSLRGPRGVLMDRIGNTLDRSLLLAELLRLAGHDVRVTHAKLGPEQIDKIWNHFAEIRAGWDAAAQAALDQEYADQDYAAEQDPAADATAPEAATPTETSAQADAPLTGRALEDAAAQAQSPEEMLELAQNINPLTIMSDYGLDAAGTSSVLDNAAVSAQKLGDELQVRTIVHWGRLFDMGAVPYTDETAQRDAAAKQSLNDHWWVELNSGGSWIALDTIADVPYGQAIAQGVESFALNALPAAMSHQVSIKLVAEQWKDGKLSENLVLSHDMTASQQIGERISVKLLPTHWPEDWPTVTPEVFQRQLKAAAVTQSEWVPVISIADKQFTESSVRDNGTINPNPDLNSAFGALGVPTGGGVARVTDLFDTEPAPEEGGPAPEQAGEAARVEGELTALWIDYEIRVPGQAPRTVRRQVFDLLGPAKRSEGIPAALTLTPADREQRSIAMIGETEVLIQPCEFSSDFLLYLSSQSALANKPFLDAMSGSSDPFGAAPANTTETLMKMVPGPGSLHALAAARFSYSGVGNSVYIAEPNILSDHTEMVAGKNGDFFGRHAIDIVNNTVEIGVNATSPSAHIRTVQGIVDSNAEILVLSEAPHLYGAAELFEHTGMDTSQWVVLKAGDEAKLMIAPLPPDVIARIGEDLRNGYVVVAPSIKDLTNTTAGWWRIDPKTGSTLGVGANGWGTSLVEYAFVLTIKTMLAQMVCMAQAGIANAAGQPSGANAAPSGSHPAGSVGGTKMSLRGFQPMRPRDLIDIDILTDAQRGISKGANAAQQAYKDVKNSRGAFEKGATDAFKFCMVTALFGGFMAMATTPIMGPSMFPDKGPRGRLPGEGFDIPPGTRIRGNPSSMENTQVSPKGSFTPRGGSSSSNGGPRPGPPTTPRPRAWKPGDPTPTQRSNNNNNRVSPKPQGPSS